MNGADFPALAEAALALLLGTGAGWLFFRTLRQVADGYVAGEFGRSIALQLGRIAGLAALLYAIAQLGALPLLSFAAGLLAARHLVLRRERGEAP